MLNQDYINLKSIFLDMMKHLINFVNFINQVLDLKIEFCKSWNYILKNFNRILLFKIFDTTFEKKLTSSRLKLHELDVLFKDTIVCRIDFLYISTRIVHARECHSKG